MEVTSAAPDKGIIQSYGNGLQYQFVDNKLTGIHSPVFCRDCIQLVVWSEITGKSVNHLGFRYTAGALDLPRKRFKIALDYIMANKRSNFDEDEMSKMKTVLHYVEDCMGIERSSFKLRNAGTFILVESSSRWIQRPYLTSLYTLLLRYSLKYDGGSVEEFITSPSTNCSDAHYLRYTSALIKLILNGDELNQTYDDYVSAELAYCNSGLMGTYKKLKDYENIPA